MSSMYVFTRKCGSPIFTDGRSCTVLDMFMFIAIDAFQKRSSDNNSANLNKIHYIADLSRFVSNKQKCKGSWVNW